MSAAAPERTCRPGFGLAADDEQLAAKGDGGGPYAHALHDDRGGMGVPVREKRMLEFMGQITDKPEWQRKVYDEAIVAKWREEASRKVEVQGVEDVYLSEDMFDYCMKELRDKAEYCEKTGIITVLDSELYLAKSDTLVPEDLVKCLKEAVAPLEDVPESKKDWHPESDEKVLDLLHPSLFPLRYGLTKVLPEGKVPLDDCLAYIGKGETTKPFDTTKTKCPEFYGIHQWLPSDLKWTPEGLEIASYVNNLHPRDHKDLYKVLQEFATAAVPLLEHVVVKRNPDKDKGDPPLEARMSIAGTSDEDFSIPEGLVYPGFTKPEEEYDEDELDDIMYSEEYADWKTSVWVLNQIEPKSYEPRIPKNKPDFRKLFPNGLQVIFKLANIHLTPEKPDYDGGSWHIEGALNDHICATALYYYDQDNITDSYLAFRQRIDEEEMMMQPAQSEFRSLELYMDIENDGSTIQDLGRVLTREGRMLAFPNVVQHQVQPFSLVDKTRPGHRKILAMFLVDPHLNVLSTSVVPPQRRDWWAEEVRKVPRFGKLPMEVFDLNIEQVEDFPISWEDALKYREELMDERSAVVNSHDEKWAEYTFNFCEH